MRFGHHTYKHSDGDKVLDLDIFKAFAYASTFKFSTMIGGTFSQYTAKERKCISILGER